jgi:signal transduction histidine kinase/ligand-binding sensor domain-containing protein
MPISHVAGRRLLEWVATVALIISCCLNSDASSSGALDYLIDNWTSDNGLPNSSVTSIAQTPDGYLWIGTYNGVSRFDGVQFINYDPLNTPELKHPRVNSLFVDAQGTLWINTYDGSMTAFRDGVFTFEWQGGPVSAVFSRSNQIFFALATAKLVCRSQNARAGDWNGDWQSINVSPMSQGYTFREDRDGALWYKTRRGEIARVSGTNSEPLSNQEYLNGENANSLTSDDQSNIWVATEKRLLVWRGGHFEDQTPTNGDAMTNISFFTCAPGNACWVLADGRVRLCADRQWVSEPEEWKDLGQADFSFLTANEDRDKGVWFRHYGLGLFHAKLNGDKERISTDNGLPGNRVSSWFQDFEGNVWVGLDHGGLVRLRERKLHVMGTAEGLTIPAVSSVCEDNESNVWIGTFGGGLNRLRDGVLTRFTLTNGTFKGNFFCAYPDSRGRVWLSAGLEDLYVMETNQISEPASKVHGIKALLVDHQDRVWRGKRNGVSYQTDATNASFTAADGIEEKDIRSLAEDAQGNIWLGSSRGILCEYSGGKFKQYRINDSLDNQAIWALLPDTDGSLWVGTFRGGLVRLKDGKFTRYTTQSGLPSDIICQILDDGLGKLWIGSHKGIFYLRKDSFKEFDDGRIQTLPCVAYGLYDGLPTLECSGGYQPSCWRGRDGTLWFATSKGLVSVQPGEVSVNRLPPPVVIEEVIVDGKPFGNEILRVHQDQLRDATVNSAAGKAPPLRTLEIPPGKHQLDFHYTALSFAAPDKVRFRYRLKGLDEGWVEAENKRSAHYGPLRPGSYSFQVIACNNDGIWNDSGAVIGLDVLPHFWETWWFEVFVGLGLAGAIFGTARFVVTRKLQRKLEQLRHQHAIEHERERIAKDIHDDLGAGLTQILLQSSMARNEPGEQIQSNLEQISGMAQELVGAMDEIVWAIDPENDTLDGLVTYVGKYVQEYVTQAGLRCRLDLPAQLPALAVSAEVRHNLFLAIKETLNNAVKHAHASEISCRLKLDASSFGFEIKDDGCGFVTDGTSAPAAQDGRIASGHGLKNLFRRMENVGGRCAIRSAPGSGTEVELTVMLQSGVKRARDPVVHARRAEK